MIIKRFILTMACKDESDCGHVAVEHALRTLDAGPVNVNPVDEIAVDYPDPALRPDSFPTNNDYYNAMDEAEEAWTARAEDEVYGK